MTLDYLLDTNVFVGAKNWYCHFDLCPSFWEWLIAANTAGKLASIEEVREELRGRNDELTEWANSRDKGFFRATDLETSLVFTDVTDWAKDHGYKREAVDEFMEVADYWLVAQALAHNCSVVTHEKGSKSLDKIKIPDACAALGVSCIDPFDMLRREGLGLVLGPSGSKV